MKIYQVIVMKEKQKIFLVATTFKHVGYSKEPLRKDSETNYSCHFHRINQSETSICQIRDFMLKKNQTQVLGKSLI